MQQIAVVRLDKIGDLILTTPAIASLKNAYPESHLTAIVSPYNKVVLEHSPWVDEIWEWAWTIENSLRLKRKAFDLVVVFSPTTASYWVALLSGAKIRAGYAYKSRVLTRWFSRVCLTKPLICALDQKDVRENGMNIPHEVEQNLAVVSSVGVLEDDLCPDLAVPVLAGELDWVKKSLSQKPSIGVHLSKAWNDRLSRDFVPRLLEELSKASDVFVSYGPEEASWADQLRLPENVKRFGNLSFSQWAALFHEAKVLVTANTGALHLAASQRVPVVAVFEPEFYAYHEKRWAPWKVPSLILRKDDPKLLRKIVKGTLDLAGTKENIGSNLQL